MTARAELALDLLEVVDLAVGDDLDRAVLVGERLLAAGEVDDREPAHGQADARQQNAAFFVGSPMVQRPDHALHFVSATGRVRSRSTIPTMPHMSVFSQLPESDAPPVAQ